MVERDDWFRVYRSAFSEHDPLWNEGRERTRWEAWMDLIQMAAFADHKAEYAGVEVPVRRGEVPVSQRRLADRWRWSRGKVRRFLSMLEERGRIRTRTEEDVPRGRTVITLVNYDARQANLDRPSDEPSDEPSDRPGKSPGNKGESVSDRPSDEPSDRPGERTTTEEGSNKKGEEVHTGDSLTDLFPTPASLPKANGRHIYPSEFEDAWEAYPHRRGGNPKKGAYRAWRARVSDGASPDELATAARHYAEYVRAEARESTPYVKQGSTFYGPDEPWRDFLDPLDPPGRNGPELRRLR